MLFFHCLLLKKAEALEKLLWCTDDIGQRLLDFFFYITNRRLKLISKVEKLYTYSHKLRLSSLHLIKNEHFANKSSRISHGSFL